MTTTVIKKDAMSIRQRVEERADRFMNEFDKPDVKEWIRTCDDPWYRNSKIIGFIERNNL